MSASDYELAKIPLDSPLINAAGSINGINPEAIRRETSELAETAIGAITVGSFTIPPQEGNEAKFGAPTYYYDAQARRTYNSMGLPNIGEAAAVSLAPELIDRAHDRGKPVIYSCSPTDAPEHESSVTQAVRLISNFLETNVDLVELNVGCPNIITEGGTRKGVMAYNLEAMYALVERLGSEVGKTGRLGIKLPPYISTADIQPLGPDTFSSEYLALSELANIFQDNDVFSFLVTANTIPGQRPQNEHREPILSVPGGTGGMSGPATKEVGREQLRRWRKLTGDNVDIISTLGVNSGHELRTRMQLGAAAAGGVTFLWQSRNWKTAVTDMLTEFAE